LALTLSLEAGNQIGKVCRLDSPMGAGNARPIPRQISGTADMPRGLRVPSADSSRHQAEENSRGRWGPFLHPLEAAYPSFDHASG